MVLVPLIKNNMKIEKDKIIEALKDKKVICWSDLLQKLDLTPLFQKYLRETGKQYSIQKVFMGKTLIHWVDEILKARIVNTKDKRVAYLKEKYRLASLSFDALQSCPTPSENDLDYMLLKDL